MEGVGTAELTNTAMDAPATHAETPPSMPTASVETTAEANAKKEVEIKIESEVSASSDEKEGGSDSIPREFQQLLTGQSMGNGNETLSRNHPLFEFIRMQRDKIDQMSFEDFKSQFEEHVKKLSESDKKSAESRSDTEQDRRHRLQVRPQSSENVPTSTRASDHEGYLEKIVLKFTTLSEENEAPSFTIGMEGGTIGKQSTNEVHVPSDSKLAETGHAFIEFRQGAFFLRDGGFEFGAAVRISVGVSKRQWLFEKNAAFSAGNSMFRSCGMNEEGSLVVEILSGPLKGERRVVGRGGATVGRSSDNSLSVPDRELSRKHSRIEYEQSSNRYYVCDVGSTNGTYMMLVGPYAYSHKLSLNDHILVGRTGFSINRFDYGLSEEMGHRSTMEDSCAIVQHLNVPKLSRRGLAPQSFFGVFDGHGGPYASIYLAQCLHVNVAEALAEVSTPVLALHQRDRSTSPLEGEEDVLIKQQMDDIITAALKKAFLKTDADFIETSEHAQNGSTATTVLIVGQRLYCANVGDSRTVLCRNFQPLVLSRDHKPSLEDEAKRIKDAGGFVINNRVMGELAVSRAFGDAEFKRGIQSIIEEEGGKLPNDGEEKNWDQPLIVAEPEVQTTTLTADDQFLVLACDGLYDVYTPEEVVEIVKTNLEEHGDPQRTCQELTRGAIYERNSRDNVSVILIVLNKWW